MTDSFQVGPAEELRGKGDRDSIYRFLFDKLPIQGVWISIDQALADSLEHQSHYPLCIKKLFAELLVSATIIRFYMKGEGEVSLGLRDNNISLMASVGGKNGESLRCVARLNPDLKLSDDAKLEEIMNVNAKLVLSMMPEGQQAYQSIIEANLNSVQDSFLDFYAQSMQLQVWLKVATDVDEAGNIVCNALFMQYIPDDSGTIADFEDQVSIATSLTNHELVKLSAFDCLYRLFNQEELKLQKEKTLRFECSCSEEHILNVLLSLGAEELEKIYTEQEKAEVDCNCCGRHYEYTEKEVIAYMQSIQSQGSSSEVFIHKD